MDLITGQRTYCIGVSGLGTDGQTEYVEIPFVDSGGNVIGCNYVKVHAVNSTAGNQGAIAVELSGVGAGDAETLSLSALQVEGDTATSAICGFGVLASFLATSENSWHATNGDIAYGVKLAVNLDNASDQLAVMITYGNLLPYNPIRKDQYDKGV